MPPKPKKSETPVAKKTTTKAPSIKKLASDYFLLIVESPSKCAKIESYLGPQYQCISSKGHIREIDGLSKINTKDQFQIDFTTIPEKQQHINDMCKTVQKYRPECVYLATDDDREGEAIAWHICQVCSLDVLSTKRIVFHEITQPALLHAVANPTHINLSLVAAQQARQVLDLVVGFKISPLLWRHIGGGNRKNALSAGRCQTPALRLISDHNKVFKDAIAKGIGQVNRVSGIFTGRLLQFQLSEVFSQGGEIEGVCEKSGCLTEFFERSKTHAHLLSVGKSRPSTRSPPKPFNTSRLLQIASSQLRLSPKTTMNLCQTLYQSGLITYMRTDCQKYARVFLDKSAAFIRERFGADERFVGDLDSIELKDASMPHEAIRVTNLAMQQFSNPDASLVRMYGLIWRNTVQSCMSPAKYNVTEIAISAPLDLFYKYILEVPVFLGWRRLEIRDSATAADDITETQAVDNGLLLYLEQIAKAGKPVSWTLIESKVATEDRAPTHYTEASLIQKLEDLGIGRPSTFSSIVETIQDRGYVKKTNVQGIKQKCLEWKLRPDSGLESAEIERIFGEEKDKLVIQPTGELVLEFLLTHFDDSFSYSYTKSMEDELDKISSQPTGIASESYKEICRQCHDDICERSKPLARQAKQTFALADSSDAVLLFNSYGPSIKTTKDDGAIEYCNVRPDAEIDLERAKRGEYTISELIWREDNGLLGTYDGTPVYLKRGKFGLYAEWHRGTKTKPETISLKGLDKPAQNIVLGDVVGLIEEKTKKSNVMSREDAAAMFLPGGDLGDDELNISEGGLCAKGYGRKSSDWGGLEANASSNAGCVGGGGNDTNSLRALRSDLSIRKGKFGPYIFHKTADMSKPEFYALKPIKDRWQAMDNLELIAWIKNTYRISI